MPPTSSKKVALIGKTQATGIADSLNELANYLHQAGYQLFFEKNCGEMIGLSPSTHSHFPLYDFNQIGKEADYAVVMGGDGTMLGVARQLAPYRTPLIGINQGRLGFITDIPRSEMCQAVFNILQGEFIPEQRSLLEAHIIRDGQAIFSNLALNDIVISRAAGAGMIELKVSVDEQFMYNQRSDGLIIATPTGSTAYSLSAGGPLLHPNLSGVTMVPIAPHALSNRPIVLPETSIIKVEIVMGLDASVNCDMQSFAHLQPKDQIMIQRSEHYSTFYHPKNWDYYHTLREKLHWNEYPTVEGFLV